MYVVLCPPYPKWIWILCHIYWRLFKKYLDLLLQEQEWSVREIQGIQNLDRESFRQEYKDTLIRQWWRVYFKIIWILLQRCWNQEGTNYSLQSSTKWCCRKKEQNHHGSSKYNDIWSRSSNASMGRSSKNCCLCT